MFIINKLKIGWPLMWKGVRGPLMTHLDAEELTIEDAVILCN
jgi:hypothetical protein